MTTKASTSPPKHTAPHARELVWIGPLGTPEPGLYWFEGHIKERRQAPVPVLVMKNGKVKVMGRPYPFNMSSLRGEWSGPHDPIPDTDKPRKEK